MQASEEFRISVIIPTLNEEAALPGLLHDLAAMKDLDVIVCDGGSTDGTILTASRVGARIVAGPAGRARQMNLAAASAIGDILWFLHADSRIGPTSSDSIRTAIAQGNRWGCLTIQYDRGNLFYRFLARSCGWRVRCFASCYGDQGIFCTKEAFDKAGGFPRVEIMEDLLISRILRKQQRPCLLPEPIISSSRRFEQGGRLRVWILMQRIKAMLNLGYSTSYLAAYYRKQAGRFSASE